MQALALSNIEEGMGHNVVRAQGLQERAGPEESLTPSKFCRGSGSEGSRRIAGKDCGRRNGSSDMQVSVLSHLHLRQAEEIKAQSDEIKRLSTLLEKQQTLLEQVQEQQQQSSVSSSSEGLSHLHPQLDELQQRGI